jgi:hypothetical protein
MEEKKRNSFTPEELVRGLEGMSPGVQSKILEYRMNIRQKKDDNIWISCCGSKLDKRLLTYIIQIIILTSIILFCIFQLHRNESCETQTTYIALLTMVIGIVAPSPVF